MKKIILFMMILLGVFLPVLALEGKAPLNLIAQTDVEDDDDYASDSDYVSDDDYASDSDYSDDDDYASDDDYADEGETQKQSTKALQTSDASWTPTDTAPAFAKIGPSITAIVALLLGICNLILIFILFRKINKRG